LFKQLKKTAVAAAAVLALGSVAIAQSVAANEHGHSHSHASNVRVPLTATGGIAVSGVGTNCSSTDMVTLTSGRVHLHALPKRNIVRANASDVIGAGSLGSYDIVGSHPADLLGNTIPPGDGVVPATVQFKLLSEDDNCASQPVTVKLSLVFTGGVLQSSSSACVAGTSGC
jgi:hypothetical protein